MENAVIEHIEDRLFEARDAAEQLTRASKRGEASTSDLLAAEDAIDETVRLTNARAAFGNVSVRERPTYQRGDTSVSYFRDLLASRTVTPLPGVPMPVAQARLAANAREMAVYAEVNQRRGEDALTALGAKPDPFASERAVDVSSIGSVWLPPQYLLDLFASTVKAAGTVRSLVKHIPLPETGGTIHVPRFTSGGTLTIEDPEGATGDAGYATTDEVVAPVSSFFGSVSVSLQAIQRSNIDEYLAISFAEAYVADVEREIIAGNGSSEEFLGLLNVPSLVSGVYTSTTPTPTAFFTALGQLIGATARARLRPPSAVVLSTSRYVWAMSQTDANGVPYMRPGVGAPLDGDTSSVATLWGIPVYLSEAIPTDNGAEDPGTEDAVLVLHSSDIILLESTPIFDCIEEGVGADELTCYARYRAYAALISTRYPSSVGVLSGTGLIVPENYGA